MNPVDEKMLQHVVAENNLISTKEEVTTFDDLDNISTNTDDLQKINIHLVQPYFLLKELSINLRKKFGENGCSLNGFFERKLMEWIKEFKLEQQVVTLCFRGAFPRLDVLKKLWTIANELESWPEFPLFKRNHLEAIIRKIIGAKDPRTFKDYFKCMVDFIEKRNGGRIGFYGDYNVSDFKRTVEEALTKLDKGEILSN